MCEVFCELLKTLSTYAVFVHNEEFLDVGWFTVALHGTSWKMYLFQKHYVGIDVFLPNLHNNLKWEENCKAIFFPVKFVKL
jgi:hypothetical protein